MTLYHYTSGQGLFAIVNSGQLHCSHIDFMNDPSESFYFSTVLENVFDKVPKTKEIYSTLFNESYHRAVADPFEKFIASFSMNEDSLSMWNYYSKGNGYNLGLDVDGIINNNQNENVS